MRNVRGMWLVVGAGVILLALAACSGSLGASPAGTRPIRYVALGDSYTIGTSVGQAERWPDQLVARLSSSVPLQLVANLGVNGYSTADLIYDELPRLDALQPEFMTLLIGVNDVVRGVSREDYRAHLSEILTALLEHVPADRLVVVSTPDYTLTPSGAAFGDPAQQSAAIADFNAIERAAAEARSIAWVDISAVAARVPDDRALVAGDGLHPSGKQYAGWVDLVAPVVERLLGG